MYRDAGPSSGAAGVAMQPSPSNVPRRSPALSAAIRQLKPMKQRVGYLQQQVSETVPSKLHKHPAKAHTVNLGN